MKIYSEADVRQLICIQILNGQADEQTDSGDDLHGQIVIYTKFFRWKDGTIRDVPEKT